MCLLGGRTDLMENIFPKICATNINGSYVDIDQPSGRDGASARQRLGSKISIDQSSGCWIWTAYKNKSGYGVVSIGGMRAVLAHRVIYELLCTTIAPGKTLDHLCRVRACVNPAHLEQVSNIENILRGVGFTANNARKTHCKNGHEFCVDNTYIRNGHRSCRECNSTSVRAYRLRKTI